MMTLRRVRSVMCCVLVLWCLACGGKKAASSTSVAAPVSAPPATSSTTPGAPKPRLVMLGFDGVDPRWLETWAKAGKLPTIQKLIEANGGSGYRHLLSTNPPQSPVAWTSFATGTWPGEHGIFDFIARGVNSAPAGLPILLRVATTSFEVQPSGPPVARNLRTGVPFWQTLGNDGVRVVALNVPYSFPPDAMRDGRILSGLGVPDLRETNSTFTYVATDVTDDQVKHPPGGGVMVPLTLTAGAGQFSLEGPSVPGADGERMKLPATLKLGAPENGATLTIAGNTIALSPGAWSEFVTLDFSHEGTHIKGIAKLLLLEAGKKTRLFISPIGFDPRDPYAPLSFPRTFSGQVATELGHLYKTVGWDHDTSALNAEVVDDAAFLKDMDSIENDRRHMLLDRLAKPDWDLLIWVSTATDRASHMFYRLMDKEHPRYDAALAKRFGDTIEREYQRMDATIAAVQKQLGPQDTLLVLSDHGFHNYRRGLQVNQWLMQQGLLTLKNGAPSSEREFLIDVDWSKTKAYAVGTGQVYLNLKGRERDGIVEPGAAAQVISTIQAGLKALRDKERGNAEVVHNVYIGSEIFHGGRASDAPDMQIAFAENYRTSWETILGGIPKALFTDNDKKWSGDHAASDVTETPGILLCSRPLLPDHPAIVDFAPTAHAFFGKPLAPQYAGKALLEVTRK